MRVCLQVSTGKILEMQSAATAGTLLKNAAVAFPDILASDLEEREVTPTDYAALQALQPASVSVVSAVVIQSPVDKLVAFLRANPDVAALIAA